MEVMWIKTWILTTVFCSAESAEPCPQHVSRTHFLSLVQCEVQLAARQDMAMRTVNADGTLRTSYTADEVSMECVSGALEVEAFESRGLAIDAEAKQYAIAEDGSSLRMKSPHGK